MVRVYRVNYPNMKPVTYAPPVTRPSLGPLPVNLLHLIIKRNQEFSKK
jgi:hypothetical protein